MGDHGSSGARSDGAAQASATIDGVLRGVFFTPCVSGPQGRVAHGRLYSDRKRRFTDGDDVCTSYLVSGPDAAGLIHTRNSVYRIETYAEGANAGDCLKASGESPQ